MNRQLTPEHILPIDETAMQLGLLRDNLSERTYPGYPTRRNRLIADPSDMEVIDGRIVIPDGPWTIASHANQMTSEELPDAEAQQAFMANGLTLDAAGRPLHPWFNKMLTDPSIGVVSGKGFYRQWGPNYTADPIVIQNDHLLLVKRKDTGLWALPGGFIDPGENGPEAAAREAFEESRISIPEDSTSQVVYQGPVVDLRVTAHAWPETVAVLYKLPNVAELPTPTPQPGETDQAEWIPLDVVLQGGTLFGSHSFLLRQALTHL